MENNSQNHGQQFSAHINARENYELQFWAKRFHINRATLKEAVDKVGNSTEEIERYLRKRHLVR
jgi:hypothetical protein